MLRRRVVERDLFAGLDVAQGEEEHVPARDAAEAVRLARMVDVGRRIASAARVDAPLVIELANPDLAAFRDATRCFAIADPLAEELTDLLPACQPTQPRNILCR